MQGDLIDTEIHIDQSERTMTINRVQDVEPILELNKYLQTVKQQSDWGRHVATIPNIFYEKWLREEWDRGNIGLQLYSEDFNRLVERKLQDPDWKFLRTDSSQVQGFMGFGS
jgi:hypothetical protein